MRQFILMMILLLLTQCQNKNDITEIVASIKEEFVPDSRIGIFSITATNKTSVILLKGETDNKEGYQKLIKTLREKGYNIEDSITVLPVDTTNPWALITVSTANMRLNPSHDAEMGTQALMGTPLRILKEEDGWLLVQTPEKYLSWIEEDVVEPLSQETFEKWRNSERVFVTAWLDFLRDPDSNQVVTNVTAGCILRKSSETKDTWIVITPDGRTGKLSKNSAIDFNLWKEKTIPEKNKILETAMTFIGTPYLWGGTSIKGVDCSGFVKTVYYLNGCILARDASQQVLYGEDVPVDDKFSFNPGDLVFFGRRAKDDKPEKVTHVGLYLGDSEFIHSSGLVKINSFDSTRANYSRYRTISLLKVRRIFGSIDSEGIQSVKNHPWY